MYPPTSRKEYSEGKESVKEGCRAAHIEFMEFEQPEILIVYEFVFTF